MMNLPTAERQVCSLQRASYRASHLIQGNAPPHPRSRRGDAIEVAAQLSAVLQIRWRREELELTQGQLAKRAGFSQQQIAKLEDPDGNPTVATMEKLASALGPPLEVNFTAA